MINGNVVIFKVDALMLH